MSVFEPNAESDHHNPSDLPQFRSAMRGFDRHEVAAYLQELSARVEDERQRAEQAERTIAQLQLEMAAVRSQSPSFEHLGIEAAKVLEQAGHSAELLVDEADNRGKAILEEARARAADLVAAAEQRAEQVRSSAVKDARQSLEEARDSADRVRRESRQERAEVKGETDRLQSFHDSLLERLDAIREELSALLGGPPDRAPARAEPGGGQHGRTPEPAVTRDPLTA